MGVSEVRGTMTLFNDFSKGVGLVRGRFGIHIAYHSDRLGIRNSTRGASGTYGIVRDLLRFVGHNRTLSRRGVHCYVSLIGRNDRSGVRRLTNSYVYVASGKGPVGPGAVNRGHCYSRVTGGAIAVNMNPTNANGACLTITVTIATFEDGRVGQVVLAEPTIRTNRGLNFLPNSLRDGISPCLHPLCSTLFSVLNTRACRGCIRENGVRITPLTCVQKEALSSDFVVLSRTRGAAERRVGVFLAQLKFGSGVMVANSVARVSLPGNTGDNLGSYVGVLGGVSSVNAYFFSRGSIIHRHLIRSVVGTCTGFRGASVGGLQGGNSGGGNSGGWFAWFSRVPHCQIGGGREVVVGNETWWGRNGCRGRAGDDGSSSECRGINSSLLWHDSTA